MSYKGYFTHNITAVVGDTSSGKSHFLYDVVDEAINGGVSVWEYGLREDITNNECKHFYSIDVLYTIKNSLIIIDEVDRLFDLNNRANYPQIEDFLRNIDHNNNKLILCGLPRDFKKFIGGRCKAHIFFKTTKADCINGSPTKACLNSIKLKENNPYYLDLPIGIGFYKDSVREEKVFITYNEEHDTKKDNVEVFA